MLEKPDEAIKLHNQKTQATLGTRHGTKTNKTETQHRTTQETKEKVEH